MFSFFYFFYLINTGRVFFFFFSSRRRHTRLTCDWSSDVCSSDLTAVPPFPAAPSPGRTAVSGGAPQQARHPSGRLAVYGRHLPDGRLHPEGAPFPDAWAPPDARPLPDARSLPGRDAAGRGRWRTGGWREPRRGREPAGGKVGRTACRPRQRARPRAI